MGDETAQPGQRAPGPLNGPPAAGPDPAADPTSEADADPDAAPPASGAADEVTPSEPAIPSPHRPRQHALRPLESLERLDRQWESSEPIGSASSLTSLELTVPEDPRGFDYLGALTGDAPATVATTEALWLEAQLAADALAFGRLVRPTVALVPLGRAWHVIRAAGSAIWVIDGPGWPTPIAAVSAARLRYRAALLAEIAAETDEDEISPATAPADRTTSTEPTEEVR
jgi:hypothetical protein